MTPNSFTRSVSFSLTRSGACGPIDWGCSIAGIGASLLLGCISGAAFQTVAKKIEQVMLQLAGELVGHDMEGICLVFAK